MKFYAVIASWEKKITRRFFGVILREHELTENANSLTGAFYMCLAVFVGLIFFSKPVMMSALLLLLICDTAAALVGRKIGTHPILDKTIEGSTAFFIAAIAILSLSSYWGLSLTPFQIVVIAGGTTLMELISSKIKIDDNLTIIIASVALISIFS